MSDNTVFLSPQSAETIQNGGDPLSTSIDTNINATAAHPVQEGIAASEMGAWYLTDTVAGHGPRPDYLESKYRSVEAQAKAYTEARKALGAMSGAPENYDLSEVQDSIQTDNEHIKDFLCYAKENKLSQDAVGKFLKTFVDYSSSFLPNEEAEIAKVGPQTVDQVRNWAKSSLSPKALAALDKLPVSAEIFEALNEIRQMSGRSPSLPTHQQQAETFKPQTLEDVKSELRNNYARYQKDEIYRKGIDARFSQLAEKERSS